MVAAMRLRLLLRQFGPDICIAHGNRAMSLLRHAGAGPLVAVLPNYKMTVPRCRGGVLPDPGSEALCGEPGRGRNPCLYHIPNMVDVPPSPPTRSGGRRRSLARWAVSLRKKGFDVFITGWQGCRRRAPHFVPFWPVTGLSAVRSNALPSSVAWGKC